MTGVWNTFLSEIVKISIQSVGAEVLFRMVDLKSILKCYFKSSFIGIGDVFR